MKHSIHQHLHTCLSRNVLLQTSHLWCLRLRWDRRWPRRAALLLKCPPHSLQIN